MSEIIGRGGNVEQAVGDLLRQVSGGTHRVEISDDGDDVRIVATRDEGEPESWAASDAESSDELGDESGEEARRDDAAPDDDVDDAPPSADDENDADDTDDTEGAEDAAASDRDPDDDAPSDEAPDGDAGGDDADEAEDGDDRGERRPPTVEELDEEAEAAADFLEGLLDALELPGNLHIRIHEDHAEVELVDVGGGALIGRRGQTLDSLQELVRAAVQHKLERRARVMIDVEGYRARRMEKLIERAEEAIDEVLDTGDAVKLQPMDAYERKAVHDIVAGRDGVMSSSIGREPARRVVIEPE